MVKQIVHKMIAAQLRKPNGSLGRIAARTMDSMNKPMNKTTVECMAIKPDHNLLDVGFGGGIALDLMIPEAQTGMVTGIELSQTMLARAHTKYYRLIASNQVAITAGSVEYIPFEDNCFDGVCTVNTLYFWQEPEQAALELFRVLKPAGRMVLSFRPVQTMKKLEFTRYNFTLYENEQVYALLKAAGFENIRFTERADDEHGYVCTVAEKT